MDNTTSIADKIIVLDEPGFSSRVSHENAALLGRLYVGLVVTPNAISHRDKGELGSVKEVSVFGGKVQELVGQAIVILLLLYCIVEGRVTQVLLAIRNEELFQLGF